MLHHRLSLIFGLLLVASTPLHAASETAERLVNFLDGLETLQAKFDQTVLETETNQTGLYHGIFLLRRPKQFRWDYVSPYEQTIIADGRDIWVLDEDLEQVTRRYQEKALKGTPAKILLGTDNLEDEFDVIDIGYRVGLNWLELLPKEEESPFVRILLAFGEKNLERLEMTDHFGKITRFRFYEIQRNPDLEPRLFEVDIPDGFDLFTDD